jgi:hypothetical protein
VGTKGERKTETSSKKKLYQTFLFFLQQMMTFYLKEMIS